jgi:hypothetical protein
VLVLDVTEEEADKILLTLDPSAAMAESDSERIKTLLETVRTDSDAVQDLLRRTAGNRLWEIVHPDEVAEAEVALDRADELAEKWRTATGQLWQAGLHRSSAATLQMMQLSPGFGKTLERGCGFFGPIRRTALHIVQRPRGPMLTERAQSAAPSRAIRSSRRSYKIYSLRHFLSRASIAFLAQ